MRTLEGLKELRATAAEGRAVLILEFDAGFDPEYMASTVVAMIDGLLLEMSLVPLYEGQRLWKDILHRLEEEGLILWQIIPGFSDPESGRSLQFDGVFYRDPARS